MTESNTHRAIDDAMFEYPGDHPGGLGLVQGTLQAAERNVAQLTNAIATSRSKLLAAWDMAASAACDGDLGKIETGLPTLAAELGSARASVHSHSATLAGIRGQVDTVRADYLAAKKLHVTLTAVQPVQAIFADPSVGYRIHGCEQAMQEALLTYQRLLAEANASARSCSRALAGSPGPAGGFGAGSGAGRILDDAGLGAGGLAMMRYQAELGAAVSQAKKLVGGNPKAATEPETAQQLSALSAALSVHRGDAQFMTAFYAALGPARSAGLMARVPMLVQSARGAQIVDPAVAKQIQAALGDGFALATRSIAAKDIVLVPAGPVASTATGLTGAWLGQFLTSGRQRLNLATLGTVPVPKDSMSLVSASGSTWVLGYVPIMATLSAGRGLSAPVLKALGDDMMKVEHTAPRQQGERAWLSMMLRWNLQAVQDKPPLGNDPFVSWATAAGRSPSAGAAVLAEDAELLDHLINGRQWRIRESGDVNFHSTPVTQPGVTREGLIVLGAALPAMIGMGSGSPNSKKAFDNLMTSLGSADKNSKITADHFKKADYIAPELRPGVVTSIALNMDTVHTVMTGPSSTMNNKVPTRSNYGRVLADVGKDSSTDPGGTDVKGRLIATEGAYVDFLAATGAATSRDFVAQARVAGTVLYGSDVQRMEEQRDIDNQHNTLSHVLGFVGKTAADAGGGAISAGVPETGAVAAPVASWLKDVIDHVVESSDQDLTAGTAANMANRQELVSNVLAARVRQQEFTNAVSYLTAHQIPLPAGLGSTLESSSASALSDLKLMMGQHVPDMAGVEGDSDLQFRDTGSQLDHEFEPG